MVKNLTANTGDVGSVPGLRRSPGEGNGNPVQYSFLENPTEGGAWQATAQGVAKSQTGLNDFTFTFFPFLCTQYFHLFTYLKIKMEYPLWVYNTY